MNFLLNGNCYGKDALSRTFFNKIGDTIDYLVATFRLDSVTTKERVDESVSYSLTSDGNNTENEIAVIRCLTFGEYMTYKNFSDADKEWAELYLKDLEENKKSPP